MTPRTALTITALSGMPLVQAGDDLASLLIAALDGNGVRPRRRDILVVAQKIVSKAEGAFAVLSEQVPTPDEADLILYNTCSIRDKAEQKVFHRLA